MKLLTIKQILVVFTLALVATSSQAGSLSQSDLDKYIRSIELMKASDSETIKSIEESLHNNDNMSFDIDENGNIALMSQMFNALSGDQKSALEGLVDNAGFSSLSKWISLGDKVSAAMIALEMKKNPVDTSEMTPEMLAMIPPEMRKQFEGAMRIMEAAKKVPADDIAIVEANYSKLQAVMEDE